MKKIIKITLDSIVFKYISANICYDIINVKDLTNID